jgi:hypothetical protein
MFGEFADLIAMTERTSRSVLCAVPWNKYRDYYFMRKIGKILKLERNPASLQR